MLSRQLPVFDAKVLELFLALERRPDSYHGEDARRLARMLGLMDERLKVCFVNDESRCSGYPPGHLTDIAFWKVRSVREMLLAACAERAGEPVTETVTETRRRGRPPSGAAMTGAERVRKHRERQRKKGVGTTDTPGGEQETAAADEKGVHVEHTPGASSAA